MAFTVTESASLVIRTVHPSSFVKTMVVTSPTSVESSCAKVLAIAPCPPGNSAYGTARQYLQRVKQKYAGVGRPTYTKLDLADRIREDRLDLDALEDRG